MVLEFVDIMTFSYRQIYLNILHCKKLMRYHILFL